MVLKAWGRFGAVGFQLRVSDLEVRVLRDSELESICSYSSRLRHGLCLVMKAPSASG